MSRADLDRYRKSFPALTILLFLIFLLVVPAQALAGHPDRSHMYKVKELAREVEREASRLHRTAERHAHHGDRAEAHALKQLHELEEAAEHFYYDVKRNYRNPSHTAGDYRRLARCWHETSRSVHALHGFRHVERLFYEVARAMDDLEYYYSDRRGYDRYDRHHRYDGYRGHGRYRGHGEYRGHGRYRGHGHYRDGRHVHRRGCGHPGYSRDRDRHHVHSRACDYGRRCKY